MVAADAPSESTRCGTGGEGVAPPPPSHPRGPDLLGLLHKNAGTNVLTGGGVPGEGNTLDQPPGSLCALPRERQNCYSGGGEPILP